MRKFRRSEVFFIVVGLLLIAASLVLLMNDISLVRFFNLHLSLGDPFTASYYSKPNSAPPASTPVPAVSSPTPGSERLSAPDRSDPNEISIYLTAPANQAIIPTPKNPKTPAVLVFKFEIYPKSTKAVLELRYKNEVVLSQAVDPNSQTPGEIHIPLPKPGLYQWQVKTLDKTSELRTLVINEKH
jgi:hypothetical protein